jgi:hypothetical protein
MDLEPAHLLKEVGGHLEECHLIVHMEYAYRSLSPRTRRPLQLAGSVYISYA